MTALTRTALRVAFVLRCVPGTIYITLGTITLPLIALAGVPLTSGANLVLITWGTWRMYRRQRALSGWTPWRP
jgi:hypothetical protein